ncbi:MAG: extracellular solute-binding protein [Candidatus Aquilonibacter sp.]
MKMHVHRFLAPLTALVLPVALLLPAGAAQAVSVQGTTNLAPLVAVAAADYQKANPGVTINVKGNSSGAGIAALKDKSADVAMSDVAVNDADFNDTILGVVGFAFALNPDVGVKNLTRGELQDIFSGKITNWKAIGGNDRKIVLIGRQIGTGTRFVFEDKVAKTEIPITIEPNAKAVVEAVAQTSGALGYLASGFVDGHDNLIVSYEGVMPTPANIRNHTYSFSTDEHLYMLKNGPAAAAAFIQYVKNDAALLKDNGVF